MSKVIQHPNGLTSTVSDKVADIFLKRKGYSLVSEKTAEHEPVKVKK